jgi:hypothetical protein
MPPLPCRFVRLAWSRSPHIAAPLTLLHYCDGCDSMNPVRERGPAVEDNSPKLAERYSVACTRSGLGALVFACVGILTFVRTFDFELYRDALEVARLGERLSIGIEEVNNTSCWPPGERKQIPIAKVYLALCKDGRFLDWLTFEERATWSPISRPPDRFVESRPGAAGGITLSVDGSNAAPGPTDANATLPQTRTEELEGAPPLRSSDRRVPMPPTNLSVVSFEVNNGAQTLFDVLTSLDNPRLIASARAFSNDLEFRIYRWMQIKAARNATATTAWWRESPGLMLPTPPDLILTVADLEELSRTYPVRVPEVEVSGSNYRIGIPTLAIAASLRDAALLISAAMLLLSIYFWAHFRLAIQRPSFPEAGTLFHAFSSTGVGRIVFCVLIIVPAISAALVSAKPLNFSVAGLGLAGATIVCGVASLYAYIERWRRVPALARLVAQ